MHHPNESSLSLQPSAPHVPQLSLSQPISPNVIHSDDFPYRPRSNSDNGSQPSMRHVTSWSEPFNRDFEGLLPKTLLDEISGPENANPLPPASPLSRFEQILSNNMQDDAKQYLLESLKNQSDTKESGKILRSAAEIAKRMSEIPLAIELFAQSTITDPTTAASWIDRAKLLDELGDYNQAEAILQAGVTYVSQADQLIRKLLKSFERTNNLIAARNFLCKIYHDKKVDEDFVLIEGGLFELRQRRVENAMILLNYIRQKSGWKPNVYSELIQFYERSGTINEILDIVKEGAKINSRNALVCQAYLRNISDPKLMVETLQASSSMWTSEFTDKMTTTVCETLATRGEIYLTRQLLSEAIVVCSFRQRYKLLLTAATIELSHGDGSVAPLILDMTLHMTPNKSKPLILILIGKVYELNNDYTHALSIFEHTAQEYAAEWRVFFELAQFHVHRNNIPEAINVLTVALNHHQGSGRLWAFRVQLEAFNGIESQVNILRAAINAVPKSGEVWCEAARIALNPLTPYFNVQSALQYLEFAYRFTPQHGDSLIEMLRASMLLKGFDADFSEIQQKFVSSEGNYGLLFVFIKQIDERPLTDVFQDAVKEVRKDLNANAKVYSRAIARSSFVIRSIFEEEARLKDCQAEGPVSAFAFGLTNVSRFIVNPALCENQKQLLSIVLGTSACGQ
ncbi:hypothetical protein TRFO_22737 [Tritrichomonas foetus]|uniref:TPR Domain containing protein n=1 Tax=Tritrichomonas foetus TaxID=1144522 RepID=A0A1J4KG84_9EUKA|nr:hypothetical protein TRFO_22734 [Tritrichomonas foetus]OHT08654.1 hypothetical protein TRFO_22737 [Tritrichomonas foetus]|eukprot:OHT08652.1 hypothetical protein TRFO_22734 [Tritrichomonas foetus]